MKKLAVIFLFVFIACGASGIAVAHAAPQESLQGSLQSKASSEESERIRVLVNQIEGVQESVVIAYGDNVGVAIRTKGIFLSSQDKKIRREIEDKIKENFPQYNNIIVLTRVKDFYSLKGLETQLNEGANPLEIYKTLIEIYRTPKKQLPEPHQRKRDNKK